MGAKLKIKNELKDYLILMSQMEPLGAEAEAALLDEWRQGKESSLRSLIEAYLPRVLALAAAQRGQGLAFQRLIALANNAMIARLRAYRGPAAGLEAALERAVQDSLHVALKN